MNLLLIGIGGFFGAVTRYLVDGWVSGATAGSFPYGTLAVNVTGSFLLGLLFAASVERAVLPTELRGPVLIGFIGAYTTFSTLMLETWRLVEDGSVAAGMVNLGASAGLGILAVFAGLVIGRTI
jgi:CrcB protein